MGWLFISAEVELTNYCSIFVARHSSFGHIRAPNSVV